MTKLNELKIMNDAMILYLKKVGMNCKRNEIIKKILEDEACFFKMDKNDAYIILQDIGIGDEQMEVIYSNLISTDSFYNLVNSKKIDANDEELKIKHKIYEPENIFKKRSVEENTSNNKFLIKADKENFFTKLIIKIKKMLHIK